MDRKPQEKPEIERLIRISDVARTRLNHDVAAFRSTLDVPSRLRTSLMTNPTKWLLGSLGSGFVASLLLRRKPRREKNNRRFSTTLLGLTLTAARPLAKVWLTNQATHWIAGRLASSDASSSQSSGPNSPKPF